MTRNSHMVMMMAAAVLLALVPTSSGCGLANGGFFDGFSGGNELDCQGDVCTCVDQNDGGQSTCIGSCECIDGDLSCIDEAFACSVTDDDGCFNSACVCTSDTGPQACGCGDVPGTCTGSGQATVDTFDDGLGCLGDCSCRVEQGAPSCRCNGACLIQAEGQPCDNDEQCAAISFARQVGCVGFGQGSCDGGELCAQVGGDHSYCFVDGTAVCPAELTARSVITDIGVLTVCGGEDPGAARCNGSVCSDTF